MSNATECTYSRYYSLGSTNGTIKALSSQTKAAFTTSINYVLNVKHEALIQQNTQFGKHD